ncbi:MAG: hypothetical protein JWO31_3495 [Phycisphaerales bacterium]|nr:hypothetical protein [Phycisphaerales bacterium]
MTNEPRPSYPASRPDDPSPRPSADPLPAVPLGYASPGTHKPAGVPFEDVMMFLFRRAVFALGVGLLVSGLVAGWGRRVYNDNYAFAGWGAALIALVVPFPAMWRHSPRRR